MFHNTMSRRRLIALAGAGALGAAMGTAIRVPTTSAAIAERYELIDLGVISPGAEIRLALNDMNADGVAVGGTYVTDEKYSPWYTDNGKLVKIKSGKYGATAACINDAGVIGGREYLGWHNPTQAFGRPVLWIDGEKQVLPYPEAGLPSPAEEGRVLDINNDGMAVGMVSVSGGATYPVVWRDGEPAVLMMPPGQGVGWASNINNSGLILGDVTGEGEAGGCFWVDSQITFLNFTLAGGTTGEESMLMSSLDDQGRVLGSVTGPSFSLAAVLNENGGEIELFPAQGDGEETAQTLCSSGASTFGGSVTIGGKEHAVIWDGGSRTDLKSLISKTGGLRLMEVSSIAPDGTLAGMAIDGDGALHAFQARPV